MERTRESETKSSGDTSSMYVIWLDNLLNYMAIYSDIIANVAYLNADEKCIRISE